MYLPQAVESGKLFKRKKHDLWFKEIDDKPLSCRDKFGVHALFLIDENEEDCSLYISDFLANDWVVKDE